MAVLMLLASAVLAAAPAADAPLAAATSPCPNAVAWYAAHPASSDAAMEQRDAARTLSKPAFRDNLHARFEIDQKARRAWLAAPNDVRLTREVNRIDAANGDWLQGLLDRHITPRASEVGERGLRDLWLLVQHSDKDVDMQERWLAVLTERYRDGELAANDLARLTDRVLKNRGKPQRYGTQFPPEAWISSRFVPPDGQTLADYDRRRAELGLMPLADYACQMTWERTRRP